MKLLAANVNIIIAQREPLLCSISMGLAGALLAIAIMLLSKGIPVLPQHYHKYNWSFFFFNITGSNINFAAYFFYQSITMYIYLCVSILFSQHSPPDNKKEATLKARFIGEGYFSNRESFNSFKCKFKYLTGTASNYKNGSNENLSGPVLFEGIWNVNDKFEKYELIDQTNLNSPENKNRTFLRNGAVSLTYSPTFRGINIRSPKYVGNSYDATPFSMAIMGNNEMLSPYSCYNKSISGEFRLLKVDSIVNGDERLNILFFAENSPDEKLFKITISPSKGFLPLAYEVTNKDDMIIAESKLIRSKKMENGSWLPLESQTIFYFKPGNTNEPVYVHKISINSFELDPRFDINDFSVVLPKGHEIANPSNLIGHYDLNKDEKINPNDLPMILKKTEDLILKHSNSKQKNNPLNTDSSNSTPIKIDYSYYAIFATFVIVNIFGIPILWFIFIKK